MELETVLYRVEGNVGIVSLNRTKALNAMSKQIFVDLTTAFDAAEKDDTVRCVVVNAEGRAFCAGGDIPEMKGLDNPTLSSPPSLWPTVPSPVPAPPCCWPATSPWSLTTLCSWWPSVRWV